MPWAPTILVYLLGPILINRWFAPKNARNYARNQMAFMGLTQAVLRRSSDIITATARRRITSRHHIASLSSLLWSSRKINAELNTFFVRYRSASEDTAPANKNSLEDNRAAALRSACFLSAAVLYDCYYRDRRLYPAYSYGSMLGANYCVQKNRGSAHLYSIGSAIQLRAIGMT